MPVLKDTMPVSELMKYMGNELGNVSEDSL